MPDSSDIPDVGPDAPSFSENEGSTREDPLAGLPLTQTVSPHSFFADKFVLKKEIRERDIVWCEALIGALGQGIIDTYQMAGILEVFNNHRPEKQCEQRRRPEGLPGMPASMV